MKINRWFGVGTVVGVVLSASVLLAQPSDVWAGGAGPFVQSNPESRDSTDRLIVKLRDKQAAQALALSPVQMSSLSTSAGIGLSHFRAMSGDAQVFKLPQRLSIAEVEAIARRLSADPQVEYAEPDRIMRPLFVPNDTRYVDQWHYKSHLAPDLIAGGANLPGAWDITTGSASIVVAVIDTGLVPHADIDTNILDNVGKVVPGYDFVSQDSASVFLTANDGDGRDSDPTDPGDWITSIENASGFFAGCGVGDSSWHGTHVAGTIGALGNNVTGVAGINWLSKILPVRVLGKCGGYLSDIVDGMRWAAGLAVVPAVTAPAIPAKVLNLSLGGGGACSTTEQTAIDAIVAAGAVVVVAAGNSNVNLGTTPASPATCNNVISVAAVNRNGGRAYYSNFGTTVEIAAPGGAQSFANDPNGVLSTLNTGTTTPVASPGGDAYVYYQGTSMAAPHVAGIVSLMLSANPALTPAQVLTTLQSTARAFPTGTGSDCSITTCGAGIINAAEAVAAAATGTIVSVVATDASASEAPLGTGTYTITRTGPITAALTVNFAMSGTATSTSGIDYTSVGTSVVIPASSATVSITLTPINDALFEGNETAVLTLTSGTGYGIGVPASATVTIIDDEPSVSVVATDASASESPLGTGTFAITRAGSTALALNVGFTMSGASINGTDYATVTGNVVIAALATTVTVTITPNNDSVPEGTETAILTLNAGAGYSVSTPASATVTIVDIGLAPPQAPPGPKGGCFIATAAYGTPMANDVRHLRAFRDEYLQTNEAGRWFVSLYYKFSPPFADYLRQHDDLRAVVRTALGPLVGLSKVVVSAGALAAQTAERP